MIRGHKVMTSTKNNPSATPHSQKWPIDLFLKTIASANMWKDLPQPPFVWTPYMYCPLSSHCAWTNMCGPQQIYKEMFLLLCPNHFFFLILLNTLFWWHTLMNEKWNSFVHIFVINFQFYQITPPEYAPLRWKFACFITWTVLLETSIFRYLLMCL